MKEQLEELNRTINGVEEDRDEIVAAVAKAFRVKPKDILGRRRVGHLINPRFCVYFLLRQKGWSLSEVGRACGKRDHGSIFHGIRVLKGRLEYEKKLRRAVEQLGEDGFTL